MGCVFSFCTRWGSSQSFFFLATDHCIFFLFFSLCDHLSCGPDLTHSYPAHFLTLISTTPTLVPYLLSPTDIATLITSYPIDLAIVLTTYCSNLVTLLITYPINLITILTTYPTNLVTLLTYIHNHCIDINIL